MAWQGIDVKSALAKQQQATATRSQFIRDQQQQQMENIRQKAQQEAQKVQMQFQQKSQELQMREQDFREKLAAKAAADKGRADDALNKMIGGARGAGSSPASTPSTPAQPPAPAPGAAPAPPGAAPAAPGAPPAAAPAQPAAPQSTQVRDAAVQAAQQARDAVVKAVDEQLATATPDTITATQVRNLQLQKRKAEAEFQQTVAQAQGDFTLNSAKEQQAFQEQQQVTLIQRARTPEDLDALRQSGQVNLTSDTVRSAMSSAGARIAAAEAARTSAAKVRTEKDVAEFRGLMAGDYRPALKLWGQRILNQMNKGDKQGVQTARFEGEEDLRRTFETHLSAAAANPDHAKALMDEAKAQLSWALDQLPDVPLGAVAPMTQGWRGRLSELLKAGTPEAQILHEARLHAAETGSFSDYYRTRTLLTDKEPGTAPPWE